MKDLYGIDITEKSIAVRLEGIGNWYPSRLGYDSRYFGNSLMSYSPTWGTREVMSENAWIKVCLPIPDSEIPENMTRIDEFHIADENGIGYIKTGNGIEAISVYYADYKKQKPAV